MNISPWEIYWVMQLDSINAALTILAVSVAIFWGMWLLFYPIAADYRDDDISGTLLRGSKRLAWMFIPALLLAALLPSTKTAAAMIVIPKIANSEAVQKESGELYTLAKQALRDAVDAPKDGDK